MAQKILLKKSAVQDKKPSANNLEFGEVAVNYASGTGKSFLATKKFDGTIAQFPEKQYNDATYAAKGDVSAIEADISAIDGKIGRLSGSVVNNYATKTYVDESAGNVYSSAVTYVDSAITNFDFSAKYLTVSSANSIVISLQAEDSKILNKANSAYNYTEAVSATVKNNYYTKSQVDNEIGNASARTFNSAYTNAVSAAKSYTDSEVATANAAAANALQKANSAWTYADAISDSVYTKSETDSVVKMAKDSAVESAYTNAVASAKSYTDSVVATANAAAANALQKANSAWTYADAISGSVYSKTQVDSAIKTAKDAAVTSAYTNAVASAKSYTDSAVSTASAAADNALQKANSAWTYANAISGSVYNKTQVDTAIKTAKDAAVTSAYTNAVASAKSYTDSKFDTASALASKAQETANSAYTYADSINTNLTSNYLTKKQTHSAIATASAASVTSAFNASVASAKSYTDSKITEVGADISALEGKINAVSATVKSTYWTSGETQSKIKTAKDAAVTSAYTASTSVTKSYADAISGEANTRFAAVESNVSILSGSVVSLSAGVKTALGRVYKYKGSKDTYAQLPSTGNEIGDTWNVIAANGNVPAGTNYAWTGTEWDALGGSIDLSDYATNSRVEAVEGDLSGFKDWARTTSGTLATKKLVADTSAATVAVASNSARSYTNIVSGNIETAMNTMRSALQDDIDANASAISTINTKLGNVALSATVNSLISGVSQEITDNELVIAAALTDLDSRIKTVSGNMSSSYATKDELATTNANVSKVSTNLGVLSASVINNYYTKSETEGRLGTVSGAAVNAATAASKTYTDNAVKTASGALDTRLTTVESRTTDHTNRINAIASGYAFSAVVKSTYWTSAETQTKINTATGNALTQAKSYADVISGAAKTRIEAVEASVTNIRNEVNAISATVTSTYATEAEASAYAAAALGNSMAYTDSKISGLSIGNYLTLESAGSIYNSVTQMIDANTNRINAVSATVNSNFYTKAQANTEIGNASARTYNAATAFTKTYADAVSAAAKTRFESVEANVTNLGKKIDATSATVKSTYWTSAETQTKIKTAKDEAVTSAYTASTAFTKTYADAVSAAANSRFTTIESNVTNLGKKIDATSATVKSTYWTSAETQTKIKAAKDEAVTSAYTASTAFTKTYADAVSAAAKTRFTTVESNVTANSNKIDAISATVTSDYATETEASEYAAAALGNAMAYTDMKISGLSIGNYLTMASAGSMYNVVVQKIDANTTKINTLSGSVLSNYYTKTQADAAIKTAKDAAVTSAYTASTGYTKALSGNVVNAINTVSQKVSTIEGNYVTTNTTQTISGAKTFSSTPVMSNGVQLKTDTSFTNSDRSIPFGTNGSPLNIQWVNTASTTGLFFNPSTGKVKVGTSGGYVINGKAATDLLNATGGTTSSSNFATNGTINTINSHIDILSGSVVSFSAGVKTMLSTVYTYKGTVANFSNLPATGQVVGYVYNVENANGNIPAGTNYAWNGTAWDALGGTVDLSAYFTKASAGTMYNTVTQSINANTNKIDAISATVTSTYATEAKASSYAAAALANSMDYTDSKIQDIGIGDYLTRASAGTMYNTLTSSINDRITTATANSTFVKKAGDTMTGPLTLKGEQYSGNFGLDANNSDIVRVNSIRTADLADGAGEGYMFWRDSTHYDSIWAKTGVLYFSPNVTTASTSTGYTVYHSGNFTPSNYAASAVVKTQIDAVNSSLAGKSDTGHTHDGRYVRWGGSVANTTDMTWGTLTTANGYTTLTHSSSSDGGDWGMTSKGGQIFMQLDGYYYQREGGSRVVDTTDLAGYVPTGRTVNGHALNANVTVTKADVGLGNVENTALSTWTGNTSIKSVGTITAGTWQGSKIANAYLANTGITIDGTATSLGGSVNTKNTQQENSTTANYRPLLMGTNNNAAQASIPTTTVTGTTYFNKEIYAQPSTGELGATQMKVGGHVTLQYNASTEALDFIFS